MDGFFERFLENGGGTLNIETVILNFCLALLLGFVIFISYRLSHSSAVYSPRFNASLVMLTVVTTLVMNVIGNNIALSLGMVGALSIVRFRTAIKDPRDTTYIFWCIAVGICCGVSEFYVPMIGSGIIVIAMLILGRLHANNRYLLVIHGMPEVASEVEKMVGMHYAGKASLRVKNTTRDSCEYIFEFTQAAASKADNKKSISDILYELEGVTQVNIIVQSEEVSR